MQSLKYSKLTSNNIAETVFTLMGILSEEASPLYFVSLLSRGQLLKERICSCRSKFSPLRVDHMSKSYAHPEKQIEIHASLGNIVFGNETVVLLFYVHGKHLRSCRDGQLT